MAGCRTPGRQRIQHKDVRLDLALPAAANAFNFWAIRERSFAEAVGFRLAIAFIQRMRFSFDRTRIRCVFDSGSPVQSWLKHRMSRPTRISEPRSWIGLWRRPYGSFLIPRQKRLAQFGQTVTPADLSGVVQEPGFAVVVFAFERKFLQLSDRCRKPRRIKKQKFQRTDGRLVHVPMRW